METRVLDITALSREDAQNLQRALLLDECETDKNQKIKYYAQGITYKPYDNYSFQVKQSVVRRTKKNRQGAKKYIYSVYSEDDILGSGSFGEVYAVSGKLKHAYVGMVYSAIDRTIKDKRRAIKKHLRDIHRCKEESEIAGEIPDTKTKKTTLIKKMGIAFTTMREFPGEDFHKTIRTYHYTILQMLQLSINALTALKKIDDAGIIHRDIKPANMKVDHDDMAIHIFDFGVSRRKAIKDNHCWGSHGYISPELTAYPEVADEMSDVYSMGLVLRMLWGDKRPRSDTALAKLNRDALISRRIKQYNDNERDWMDCKDEIIAQWKNEVGAEGWGRVQSILLHLTQARPENRSSLNHAIAVFKSIYHQVLMRIALRDNDALEIAKCLRESEQPDYAEFKKAIRAGQWEGVLSFIRANPQDAQHTECKKAYGDALLIAVRFEQPMVIEELFLRNAPLDHSYQTGRHVGWNALDFAFHQGNDVLMQILRDRGGSPNKVNHNGPMVMKLKCEKKIEPDALIQADVIEQGVLDLLKSAEFSALKAYLLHTRNEDRKPDGYFRTKVQKYDILRNFKNKLETSATMEEVRYAFAELEQPNVNNPGHASNYSILNAPRRSTYKFFGWDATVIGAINKLRKFIPVLKCQENQTRNNGC